MSFIISLLKLGLRASIILFGVLCVSFYLHAKKEVSFYFAAHPDDWQLFMSGNAYTDVVNNNEHVVFVIVTAGDAGLGTDGSRKLFRTSGSDRPYYKARERGAWNSCKFLADVRGQGNSIADGKFVEINGHKIYRYAYKKVVAYFLRLPDGNLDGSGFSGTGYQSLERLRSGAISKITAVDNSAAYNGWDDLTATFNKIIVTESESDPHVWVNIPDSDESFNPNDHSDHINVSLAAQASVKNLHYAGIVGYVDYHSANLPENLSSSEVINQAGIFSITVKELHDDGYFSQWVEGHTDLLLRNYYRIMRYPVKSSNRQPPSAGGVSHAPENISPKNLSKKIIAANGKSNTKLIDKIHPDPAKAGEDLFISFRLPASGTVTARLIAENDEIVYSVSKKVDADAIISFPLSRFLQSGLYFLQVNLDGNYFETKKLVLQ
jgi:hypothetical protein